MRSPFERPRLWLPRLQLPHRRFLVGAGRSAAMGAGGRRGSPIELVNFRGTDFGSSAGSFSDTGVVFDGTENAVYVCCSFEANVDVATVVVRNAADDTELLALSAVTTKSTGAAGQSNVQFWQAFDFTPIAGTLIVRATFASGTADGSLGTWTYKNATRAATGGDFASANNGSATSLSADLTIVDGVENGGFIMAGLNVNIAGGITATGALTERFEDQTHASGNTTWFGDARGGLSGVVASGASWSPSARCALQLAMAA